MFYTLAVGISFGALLGFLMASQQIYQEYFQVGDWFAVYFAASALAVGAASFCNSALVERFGMRPMVLGASLFGGLWTLLFAIVNAFFPIGLTGFVILLLPLFFSLGLCFGNLNALAMEPMGRLAGTASAIIGTLSSLVSVVLGSLTANLYDGSLVIWMAALGSLVLLASYVTRLAAGFERASKDLPG